MLLTSLSALHSINSALGGAGSNYLQGAGVYIPRHLPKGASCYRHLQTHNKTVEKFGKDSPSVFI